MWFHGRVPDLPFSRRISTERLSINYIFHHHRQFHRTYSCGSLEKRQPVSRGISTRSISVFLDLALNALSAMICCVERGSMDASRSAEVFRHAAYPFSLTW